MPIYEYQCPKCGARREEVRSVADRHPGPRCRAVSVVVKDRYVEAQALCGRQMELQVSTPAVSGWKWTVGLNKDPEGRNTF